jgi:hypothetical protein
MQIEFTYDKKSVLRAIRYHFFSKKDIRILLLAVNIFTLLSGVLYFFQIVQPLPFLICSFLWFSLMLSFWVILPQNIYRNSKTFQEFLMVDIREDKLIIHHSAGTKEWPYNAFQQVKETPDYFYLYLDERSFFLIPMLAFADASSVFFVREVFKRIQEK